MEPLRSFYLPFFDTADVAEQFIADCEAKAPPALAAKVIMHQAQRLVSISDDLPQIRPYQEPLRPDVRGEHLEAPARLYG